MPLSRAPKKGTSKASKSAKKNSKKSVAKKGTNKKAVVKKGPRLFPTKAELEALKAAKASGGSKGAPQEKSAGRRPFPTKAELEAMKAASTGPVGQAAVKDSAKKVVTKIDGEDVELEEVELEDLETLVSETAEEGVEGQPEIGRAHV